MASENSERSILVIGAGELGFAVLHHLVQAQQEHRISISVLVRPSTLTSSTPDVASKFAQLRNLNITPLGCDLNSAKHLDMTSLFAPFHTIIDCGGYSRPAGDQLKVARAILDAGVKRYLPWQFGVDYDVIGKGSGQDLFDEQIELRDILRNQEQRGTEWVVISTGMFVSFLFERWFGVVEPENTVTARSGGKEEEGEGWIVRALGSWSNAVSVTAPDDIGRVAARAALDDSIANRIVYCAGDTVSYGRLADIVEEVSGRQVRREAWTVEHLKEELKNDPENVVKKYRLVFAAGRGVSWETEDTINHQWGLKLEDVKRWALKNLALRKGRCDV